MRNWLFSFSVIAFCFVSFSCSSSKHKLELKLLFSTTIIDYSNDDANGKKYNTKIALSDSVFLVQKYVLGNSGDYGIPVVNLWINGIEKMEDVVFDSLVKRYNLRILDLNEFVHYESDSIPEIKTDSLGYVQSPSGVKSIRMTSRRISNGDNIKFTDSANSIRNTLTFFSKEETKVLSFDKKTSTTQMMGAYMKVYNVAGDLKEEIFIVTPEFSYGGLGWFVQVYQIQN